MIRIENLKKSYGHVMAVNDLSLQVDKGMLFAFLGPNGAGKSTTINIISTLLKPDTGVVTINGFKIGKDDDAIKKSLGVVFQESILDPLLTVKENLEIRAAFYGETSRSHLEHIAKQVGILDFYHRPYGKLSGGQRRRVDIARALIHRPKILILDEPTTGLDPQTRKNVWELIEKLRKEDQLTVLLTTHYMEEANRADVVMVIDEGSIVAQGTPHQLKNDYSKDTLYIYPKDTHALLEVLEHSTTMEKEGKLSIKLNNTLEALPILSRVSNLIHGFEVVQGTLDDVFIEITGKEIRE